MLIALVGVSITLLTIEAGIIIWAIRLEGRVNQHEKDVGQIEKDIADARARLEQLTNGVMKEIRDLSERVVELSTLLRTMNKKDQ